MNTFPVPGLVLAEARPLPGLRSQGPPFSCPWAEWIAGQAAVQVSAHR